MRLRDADALLEQMKHRKEYIGRPSDPVCLVEDAPTVDAVPVVRCKDCKYYQTDDVKCPCNIGLENSVPDAEYTWVPKPDWFCADGERREEDD